jgi:hypothetical protein
MSMIDERGRVFGRFNLVDAAIVAFVIVLVPLAYGTYLLFKPARPRIDSVEPSGITVAERRVSNGSSLTAKFKIRGTGLTPLLRARIGSQDALGLVYESPNSADVLVGAVPPGKHDLILLDGVQEVARANGAIDIQAASGTPLRVAGWLVEMDKAAAAAVTPGAQLPADAAARFEVATTGREREGRARLAFGGAVVEGAANGLLDREVVLVVRCDSPPLYEVCSVGGQMITGDPPLRLTLPGPYRFELLEVLPTTAPTPATATVRVEGPAAALVQAGDHDLLIDSRRAQVTAVTARTADSALVTIELGLDAGRDGWRYRGHVVRPGASIEIETERYRAVGTLQSITVGATRD